MGLDPEAAAVAARVRDAYVEWARRRTSEPFFDGAPESDRAAALREDAAEQRLLEDLRRDRYGSTW